MKVSLYLLFGIIITLCSCETNHPYPLEPIIVYPDKNLKEIIFRSKYDKSNSEKPFDSFAEAFCYDKVKNKTPILDRSLRARLYDKAGNLLAEDFIRSFRPYSTDREPSSARKMPYIQIYFPYHDNGSEFRLVKIKNGRETTFFTSHLPSESKLKEYVGKYVTRFNHYNWEYSAELECFLGGGYIK